MRKFATLFIGLMVVGVLWVASGIFWGKEDEEIAPSSNSVQEPVQEKSLLRQREEGYVQQNEKSEETSEIRETQDGSIIERFVAPDFTLNRVNGGTLKLSEYRGVKPVVLDFWTSWCPNCQRDMPRLNQMYEKHKDKVEIIGINIEESPKVAQKFVDARGITFPVVLDPEGLVAREYGIQYTNVHILIDKDGSVSDVVLGDLKEEYVTSLIQSGE
jgi:peroxiredoxin